MIRVGVTGWGDHDSLYPAKLPAGKKLSVYSKYFSVVELDASFYAVQSQSNYEKWVSETPDNFSFIVKTQKAVTGHEKGNTVADIKEEIQTFLHSIEPLKKANKLKAVLMQFPPFFECSEKSLAYLRFVKEQMGDTPCALEFRHQSWFNEYNRNQVLRYMKEDGWIHTIVDEPQAGMGSIPTVLVPTHPDLTLVRFHGRNVAGWNPEDKTNWRQVRCLYRYNQQELAEWAAWAQDLEKQSKEVCLIFNNNSAGDAVPNAKEIMKMLGLTYNGEVASQMSLF